MSALQDPTIRERIAQLSNAQIDYVIERLVRLRPKCPVITDELLLIIDGDADVGHDR
jgi:hypothetical protein